VVMMLVCLRELFLLHCLPMGGIGVVLVVSGVDGVGVHVVVEFSCGEWSRALVLCWLLCPPLHGAACCGPLLDAVTIGVLVINGLGISHADVVLLLHLVRDFPCGCFNNPSCCHPVLGVLVGFRHMSQPQCPMHPQGWNLMLHLRHHVQ
jgi:hypothetical protein